MYLIHLRVNFGARGDFAMAEYRTTLIRNGLIAIIISSLIIGVAFYGSGQIANNISSNNNYSSTQTFPASNSIGYSSTTSGSSATSSTQETTTGTITSSTSAATCCSTSTSTAPGTTPPQGTSSSSSSSSSSTTTSSSYIATNSYSTFDSTLGVVPLLSIGTGAGCCVYSTYDSPNSTVYATAGASGSLWLFGNGSLVGSLSTDNYSLSAIKGISSNSASGHVYVLNEAPGGNSCCSAWITEVSGQKFVGPPVHAWGVTSNVLADPQNGYVYFGTGGGGTCTSNPNGIQVVSSANLSQDVQFIPIGIQPPITTTTTNSTVCSPHSQFTPQRLVLDSSNGNVYVATSAPNSSTVFLVASGLGLLPENLSVPGQNIDALFNPSNGYIYSEQLVNQTTDSNGNAIGGYYFVSVIDTATNSVINGTMIPSEAQLVYDSLNHDVYAFGQKQITVLSGTTISGTYQEPTNATILSVVYDASNNEFVSFNAGSSQGNSTSSTTTNSTSTSTSSMMIVPPQNTIATIAGALGRSVAYDPSNHAIYTVDANFSGIEEINASTNSFVSNIRFACGNPFDVAFDPQSNVLYSLYSSDPSNCADKNVTLVGINPVSNSIVYHSSAHAFSNSMVYDSKDNTLFIEGRNSTQAQVMWVINASSGAVVKQLGAPVQFYMSFIWGPMLYDPVNDLLYFEWSTPGANNNYYEGSILNASSYSLVGAFNPFSGDMPPSAMTYNTSNGLVYVAEEGSGGCMGYNSCSFSGGKNVTVINGTSVSGEIPVSSSANSTLSSIAYVQGSIYVVNGTTTSTTESLTWVNSSVIGSEELTFPASALYSDPANPSWLYVFGPNSVYVIKVK